MNWNSIELRLGVVQPELIDSLTHSRSIYTCGCFPNQHQSGVRHIQIHIEVNAEILIVFYENTSYYFTVGNLH